MTGEVRDSASPGAAEEASVHRLVDRRAIHDVVLKYCRGIDRMDRELVAECFHPDAYDEHGSFEGGVEEFLEWVWPLLAKYRTTMHLAANHLCDVEGDVAVAETYGVAIHRSDDPAPHRNLDVGFRYIDRFERRGGDWRIARRVATTEWAETSDSSRRWDTPENMRVGVRNRSDSVFVMLSDLRS